MTARVRLADVARARSGDKGDLANVALFASSDELYSALVREVTAERVRAHFGRFVRGEVERFAVPNVRALNFVLHGALDGGAARSLRSDPLGKSYGSLLLRLWITLTAEEAAAAAPPQRPPR
ncbi:MAG: AtuA-related protein [Candidatus Dormibacteria bacterium]